MLNPVFIRRGGLVIRYWVFEFNGTLQEKDRVKTWLQQPKRLRLGTISRLPFQPNPEREGNRLLPVD